jgi:hypothetical protein
MRNALLVTFLAMQLAAFVLLLTTVIKVRRFLRRTPVLRSPADIQALKRFVRGDMYRSVCMIGLFVATILLFIAGIALKALHASDFLYAFAPWGALASLAPLITRPEARMRELPAEDPEIVAERKEIVLIWRTRIFPNW